MVRAKFKVASVTRTSPDHGVVLRLEAVYSNNPNDENKYFWDATPQASLSMTVKSAAAEHFQLGKEYYVDFTEAPAPK